MNIFLLTPRFPFPENGGDVLRINYIARYLKSQGAKLTLVSFYDRDPCIRKEYFDLYDSMYIIKRHRLVSLFWAIIFFLLGKPLQCGYYYSPKFQRKLSSIEQTNNVDKYVAHLIRMASYVDTKQRRSKTIIEMTDALSKTYFLSTKAKGAPLKKIIYRRERYLVEKYEGYIIKTFPKVVLVSPEDKLYLENKWKLDCKNLVIHTNGVDCAKPNMNSYRKNKICFIGNMRTLQNQDAVLFFLESIFPVIQKKIPDIQFYIIGAEPPERIQSLHDGKNIFVTGFVEDIESVVSDSAIAVAPVRIAAGIQNKVLMSMGYGIPVVMTSLISGAIPELVHDVNCMIADEPESFANSCLDLLIDSKKRNNVSRSGWNLVREKYSWNEKLAGYEDFSLN